MEKFYIPRDLAESYDGDVLRFRISEEDAKSRFMRDTPPPSSSPILRYSIPFGKYSLIFCLSVEKTG